MSAARSLSLFFAAGVVGALANSVAVWLLGELGVPRALGVALAPDWSAGWLYPRLVWGGLWGLLFALPIQAALLPRGLLVSLAPTLFQLFVVFPAWAGQGVAGLELGLLTPAFVLLYNAIWGVTASWWLQGTQG
ncbi:MAG: hypothetical protein OZ948_04355 [Deltaproteobacteria bacterium]|nr:hypothetical protein [Deltaproteobacteria bacterium]